MMTTLQVRPFKILLLIVAGAALLWYPLFIGIDRRIGECDLGKFREAVEIKQIQAGRYLQELENDLADADHETFFEENSIRFRNFLDEHGLAFFVFLNDSMIFWSDNRVGGNALISPGGAHPSPVFIGNAWFLTRKREMGPYRLYGLILLKYEYDYENRFLKNRFYRDFEHIPGDSEIIPGKQPGTRPLYDYNNRFLFSLKIDERSDIPGFQKAILLVSFFTGLLLMLFCLRRLILLQKRQRYKNLAVGGSGILCVILFLLLATCDLPDTTVRSALFSPQQYASSNFLPSLGHLFMLSLFIFFIVYNFYRDFGFRQLTERASPVLRATVQFLFLCLVVLCLFFSGHLMRKLILDSNINFEPYRVLDLNAYSLAGFLIIGFFIASFVLLLDGYLLVYRKSLSVVWIVVHYLASILLIVLFCRMAGISCNPFLVIFFLLMFTTVLVIRTTGRFRYGYPAFVLLIFLFSLFVDYLTIHYSMQKRDKNMKVLAENLADEHDPVAEFLLSRLEDDLAKDPFIGSQLTGRYVNIDRIYNHLVREYFTGFWDKYDLQITVCSPRDSVYIQPPDDVWRHCYSFFDTLVKRTGVELPDSRFYFIDNLNGRISYFASVDYYPSRDTTGVMTLFIELDSRLIAEELGYPELLLEGKVRHNELLQGYSYAKYHKGQLITQSGGFPYSLEVSMYSGGNSKFRFIKRAGYDHLVYNINEDNTILLSHPVLNLIDVVISFTYIFIFYFLLLTLLLFLSNISLLRRSLRPDFKNKIQFTIISLLLVSFLLIGSGSIYYSIQQYRQRHYDDLSEKTQSVYIELVHKLEFERDITADWHSDKYLSLGELLIKFSNVFYTDINLYDEHGDLLATSREEIFDRELISRKIDPDAYLELVIRKQTEFVHDEKIGSLRYLSSYVPFMNSENQLLAYLNLPYFTRQNVLTREISNLIVAIVNFYVLLIFVSIILAVVMSSRITQPLRMIRNRIGKISLDGMNEKIEYHGEDEIGNLVNEYNNMVDQLAGSADLLARSERETAWREMAKQIAHEIKNPLTPMKLSIQHLRRAWQDDPEHWEENVKRISQNLIEQIDDLSSIATEFSNFAKMPRSEFQEVDMETKIKNAVSLFSDTKNVRFRIELQNDRKAMVLADREQVTRVFINLIKNAIQSIPEDRKGMIRIELRTVDGLAVVRVIDNGKGIPEEIGDRLFQPNFTTKTSGMGLGLAIVKRVVENAGGSVEYETKMGEGTVFIIRLPLISYPSNQTT